MRKTIFLALCACVCFAQDHRPARHFINSKTPLTAPSAKSPREIAGDYLRSVAPEIGLSANDVGSVYIVKQYTDDHNGVTHILYRQQFQGIDVYNAAWVTNIDAQGEVLNAGGNLFAAPQFPLPDANSAYTAVRAAARAVNPKLAARFTPFQSNRAPSRSQAIRFAGGGFPDDIEGELTWYSLRGYLRPAWVFYVLDDDGASRYATIVDGVTQDVLAKRPMTYFDSVAAPRGQVFERENPQASSTPGVLLSAPPPFVDRTMQSFAGDPVASPNGWWGGAATVGNNAVVGENLLGVQFLTTPTVTSLSTGNFSFPLQLGPGAPNTLQFADAVNTNLFYWVNRAHDLHYLSGFTEAAGNYQRDNGAKGGVGGDPIYAYTHFGAAYPKTPQIENSYYTTMRLGDGSPAMLAMFVSDGGPGSFFTDGALDSEVVVHEYTHGVTMRLLPNGYDTFQVAAMGEAWSDFFSLEYTLATGAPADGAFPVGEYFNQSWGQGIRTRPYSTNTDINPLTYSAIGRVVTYPEVHADGEIWVEALWDVRANLIKQFGEAEGRRRVRILVLDGVKMMPPNSSMVDARDAILLADRVDFKGESQTQLWTAFAKRGLGALAYSADPDSTHVLASTALPSSTAQFAFYDDPITIGEPLVVVVSDANYTQSTAVMQLLGYSGDLENLTLRRTGSIYVGTLATSGNIVTKQNGTMNLLPGDGINAYYNDYDTAPGAKQISTVAGARPAYYATGTGTAFTTGLETRLNITNGTILYNLPFEFPFYSSQYKQVIVDENGLLSFADQLLTACTDSIALSTIPAIAPLWANMTSQGSTQAKEGVYVSRPTPDTVTFRWATETIANPGSQPSIANFSVMLKKDGGIVFNYGSGNTAIGSSYTYSGCNPAPTVGLSPGHGTYVQAYYQPSSTTVGINFDPPMNASSQPTVTLESPAAGDAVQDVLTVKGVAYDGVSPITRVDTVIDGLGTGYTTPSIARTDVCSQQNVPGCPNVGYQLSINLANAGLRPGQHTIQIRATNSRGAITYYPDQPVPFTMNAGQGRLPTGVIESPAEGATVSGSMAVKGYAMDMDLRITAADTLIDGVTYPSTSYGVTRNDICGTLNPKPVNCPAIGFTGSINTRTGLPPLPDGPHKVQIRVKDEAGRYTLIPDTPVNIIVKNGTYQPPIGAITAPANAANVNGTMTVTGWTYSPANSIQYVFLVIDHAVAYGPMRYGIANDAVCTNLPDVKACPNIGFTMDLDTNLLGNGPHTIQALVYDTTGASITLPAAGSPGISVNVKN